MPEKRRPLPDNVESLRQYAMERLDYDPATGVFTWRDGSHAGKRAGGFKANPGEPGEGYWRIRLRGKKYRSARLAWLFVHGEWPPDQIDHINRIRDDDRIANLRKADHKLNQENRGPNWL